VIVRPEDAWAPCGDRKAKATGTSGARIRDWKEFYDRARRPEDMLRWTASHATWLADLFAFDRILEVGTGTGMLSAALARGGRLVVSVDESLEVFRTASDFHMSVGADVKIVRADAFNLPFSDGAFGAAFSQGLLEHFDRADARRLVQEQLRVAPAVYASVPSRWYPHLAHRGPGLIGNERLLSRRRWLEELSGFGVDARYYADGKLGTFAGRAVPWPNQLILRARRDA
jgi:SAM-dependent methyltransferase